MSVNRDVKIGIKNDATLGPNDESNHGVDMVSKQDVTLDAKHGVT